MTVDFVRPVLPGGGGGGISDGCVVAASVEWPEALPWGTDDTFVMGEEGEVGEEDEEEEEEEEEEEKEEEDGDILYTITSCSHCCFLAAASSSYTFFCSTVAALHMVFKVTITCV